MCHSVCSSADTTNFVTQVDLMEQSLATPSALTVLLTGRAETIFADLIKRMLHSRHLEADMVSLKPEVSPTNERFGSTMKFKQAFLETVINTYHAASELRIYEDREKHVEQFRLYLESFNEAVANGTSSRGARTTPLQQFHVIEVPEQVSNLDPVREVALIQRLVNTHNAAYAAQVANPASVSKRLRPYALRRTVLFTGYLISPADSLRLLAAADKKPGSNMYRTLANTVMITTRQDPQVALDKAGGIGHRVTWRATATGNYDNKIWAAKVEPLHGASVHTETNPPAVVLALREGGKPFDVGRISKWTDLKGEPVEFETTVGEKVLLRIEAEEPLNGKASAGATQNTPRGYASHSGYGKPDRKRPYDEDFPTLGAPSGPRQQQNQQGNPRGPTHAPRGPARGGGGNHNNQNQKGRGGGRGGGGGQRGRGGGGKRGKGFVGYQSLDDMGGGGGKGRGGASEGEMAY